MMDPLFSKETLDDKFSNQTIIMLWVHDSWFTVSIWVC